MSTPAKYPWVAYQPLRLSYQLAYTTSILLRLPLWLVVSLVPSLRPHRQWTFYQTLMANASRALVGMVADIGITESVSLKPGKEGDQFELVQPSTSTKAYTGPLTSPDVAPAPVGTVWYPKKPEVLSTAKIALHFHGGAFVLGQARADYNGFAAKTLLEHAGFDAVLAVSYRLSGYENANPFPAALQDVLTVYLHLTHTLAISPNQIVLVGDSAGGNLVIGLLRYLEEFGAGLDLPNNGRPSSALLISPWVNPLAALEGPSVYTASPHWNTDFLPTSFLQWGAKTYGGEALRGNPYVTPWGHPFATPVPLVVLLGEAEILQTDGVKWVEEMKSVEGNEVELHFEAIAVHDTLLLGNVLGWEDSINAVMSSKLKPSIAAKLRN